MFQFQMVRDGPGLSGILYLQAPSVEGSNEVHIFFVLSANDVVRYRLHFHCLFDVLDFLLLHRNGSSPPREGSIEVSLLSPLSGAPPTDPHAPCEGGMKFVCMPP